MRCANCFVQIENKQFVLCPACLQQLRNECREWIKQEGKC